MHGTQNFEAVMGIEIHCQLLTQTKAFCSCSAKYGAMPNTQVCPVCLALPGALPVLNRKAVEFAIRMGLATHCTINAESIFARKNYFYPDLPKGYQISQYDRPLCEHGWIDIEVNGNMKKISITRIHLEEDAGKSIHDDNITEGTGTFIDLNRCGAPLIEIVSGPDFRTPQEVTAYLMKIRQLVQYLEISNGNMEEGSLRCDANISLRPIGETRFGVKTELKNMNSFKAVEHALNYEIERQTAVLRQGGKVIQQTLLWDENAGQARPMRTKEEAHDYRYFPEPDLVPLRVDQNWIQSIAENLAELPQARQERMIRQYQIPKYDAEILTTTKMLANYYEEAVAHCSDPKLVSNWIMSEMMAVLKERKQEADEFIVKPVQLGALLEMVVKGTINGKIAKTVFEEMCQTGKDPQIIVEEKGLTQITDSTVIREIIDRMFEQNQKQLNEYLSGKEAVFAHFVGQVMKLSKGKANPQITNDLLREKLNELKSNKCS